jgi:hypothetical protein
VQVYHSRRPYAHQSHPTAHAMSRHYLSLRHRQGISCFGKVCQSSVADFAFACTLIGHENCLLAYLFKDSPPLSPEHFKHN